MINDAILFKVQDGRGHRFVERHVSRGLSKIDCGGTFESNFSGVYFRQYVKRHLRRYSPRAVSHRHSAWRHRTHALPRAKSYSIFVAGY